MEVCALAENVTGRFLSKSTPPRKKTIKTRKTMLPFGIPFSPRQ
jgi:hypothetical protein